MRDLIRSKTLLPVLILAAALLPLPASAQNTADAAPGTSAALHPAAAFIEDFDDITNLPGWYMQNNSSPLGTRNWFQGIPDAFHAQAGAPNAYIAANYQNTAGAGVISNWLLMPAMSLHNGDMLFFSTRTLAGSFYADRLQVRLSTAGASTNVGAAATDVGDFTKLLLDINAELLGSGYPQAWTEYAITISGLPPGATNGRIAFRYFVPNGGPEGGNSQYIGIDTLTLTTDPDRIFRNGFDFGPPRVQALPAAQ